jgi:adenylate cyclase
MSDPTKVNRRLVAVFAADVAGYSRLMGADEVGTLKGLTERRAILDRFIGDHGGRIANTAGDSVLAEFGSAVEAVQCAVEAQTALAEANSDIPSDHRIDFRIGVHIGDVMVRAGDLFGDGVNIAARLQSIAKPGSVCISGETYGQVRKALPLEFIDLGEQKVKNIEEPLRAYEVNVSRATASSAMKGGDTKPLPLPDKPSIAVLPFQNMSGDPEQEYFADGMVEEIITALSRNKQLFVIARNSSFTFKGKAIDIKQVARDLGVRYVLEGSVRKSGSRIRITGQLIDAASGLHLWADKYDGALEDVFELQDQVVANVAGAIAPNVERAEIERVDRKLPSSLDAYDYWLRGRAAQFQYTREGIDQAIALYEQAIKLDPQFASARATLGAVLITRRNFGWSDDPTTDASRATECARSALALGTSDPFVLSHAAIALMNFGGEVEFADSLFEEAIRLDPNCMLAWIFGGWAKILLGDHHTAIKYAQRALRLGPLDQRRIPFAEHVLAFAHFFLGNYEEGLSFAISHKRRVPNDPSPLRAAMACNVYLGNIETAKSLWRQLAVLSPTDRVSETGERSGRFVGGRPQDIAKLQEAYRIAGMPE